MADASSNSSIHALVEKQAIAELVYTYSRAVDRKDFKLLEELYTESAIDDHGSLYNGPAKGYVEWLRKATQHVDGMAHHVHNIIIGLEGEIAYGEVYVTTYNRWPTPEGGFEDFIQGLRYLDRYEKQGGQWRFAHRTVAVDWAELRPSFWDFQHALLKGKRPGRDSAADPSYDKLHHPTFRRRQP